MEFDDFLLANNHYLLSYRHYIYIIAWERRYYTYAHESSILNITGRQSQWRMDWWVEYAESQPGLVSYRQ